MTKKLTKEEILHLAKLSGIKLTSEEVKSISPQLEEILKYFESIKTVETKGIMPTSQTTGLVNVYRTDEINVNQSLTLTDALYNASEVKNNLFKVPLIINREQ